MNGDSALELMLDAIKAAIYISGPVLGVALIAGLLVGIAQTVLQINEASVSFVVKVLAVLAVLVIIGPALAAKLVDYTKNSLGAIEHVVKK